MDKILKFFLNGGSAVIFLIVAFNFFQLDVWFGMSIKQAYKFTAYFAVIYLLIQGIQFNMQRVSGIGDSALDIAVSILPLFAMFYVFIAIDLNDDIAFVRNIFFLTTFVDVFVFGWGSLKILLFTDKNATPGGS